MDTGRDRGRPAVDTVEPRLSIVVPVYNEGDSIAATLRGLSEHVTIRPREIIVVYDFDEDTTVPAVIRLQSEVPEVRLHRNDIGRGVLNAIKAGFATARAPYVLVTMADLADDPGSIDTMYALAVAGSDVVAGSRYMRGGRQVGGPVLKRTLSRLAGLSLHHVAGIATHDPTNNFKLYSRRLLDQTQIESTAGFELALELTVKAHINGMGIAESPTTWRDRTVGESRFRLWSWLPHYLKWYLLAMRYRLLPRRSW
jgi:dolichol-phosphate mannosyltransferase